MTKAERQAINRENAKKSTGPRTEAGKNISKYNAVGHGLCSRNVYAKGESEKEIYNQIEAAYQSEYLFKTLAKLECVITLAELQWQILRVRRLIEFTFDRGLEVLEVSKAIDNFSRHQGRLHRLRVQTKTELGELQQERRKIEEQAKKEAIATGAEPRQENDLEEIGFVLPIPDPTDPVTDPQDYGPGEESVFKQHIHSETKQPEEIRA